MIDYFNRRGGIEGYQIEPIYVDAQSKPEVAVNEAVRLIEREGRYPARFLLVGAMRSYCGTR